jgi:hypothetical protein
MGVAAASNLVGLAVSVVGVSVLSLGAILTAAANVRQLPFRSEFYRSSWASWSNESLRRVL